MEEEGRETEATADEEETSSGGNPTGEDVYRPADVTVLQDEIDSLLQEANRRFHGRR